MSIRSPPQLAGRATIAPCSATQGRAQPTSAGAEKTRAAHHYPHPREKLIAWQPAGPAKMLRKRRVANGPLDFLCHVTRGKQEASQDLASFFGAGSWLPSWSLELFSSVVWEEGVEYVCALFPCVYTLLLTWRFSPTNTARFIQLAQVTGFLPWGCPKTQKEGSPPFVLLSLEVHSDISYSQL